MNFADAVKSVFQQYANFTGRARRSEFWFFTLFSVIVSIVLDIIDLAIGTQIIGLLLDARVLIAAQPGRVGPPSARHRSLGLAGSSSAWSRSLARSC